MNIKEKPSFSKENFTKLQYLHHHSQNHHLSSRHQYLRRYHPPHFQTIRLNCHLLTIVSRRRECKLLTCANGGKVTVEVIGSRQNRSGNVLEVPGLYKIKDPYVATEKGHLLIKNYLRRNPVNFTNI